MSPATAAAAVSAPASAPTPAPVFVLAAPFSGASRLTARLAGHPALYALPELCLFMADTVGELLDIFRLSQGPHADGLLRAVAQLEFGVQADPEIEAATQWLAQRREWTVGALLDELARRVAPRRLVIPDTETPLRPNDLRRLRRHAPTAVAVQVVRHPWTQAQRLVRWGHDRLFIPPDFKDHAWDPPLIEPQVPWLRANRNIEQRYADAPQRLHRVSDESLDDAPSATLTALCRWLELPDDAATLDAMHADEAAWAYGGHGPRRAPYGLEAEVLEMPPARERGEPAAEASLEAVLPWRPDGAGFDAGVIALARRYGYR
ncbi:MAG TPA: sulfotransferase [Solimonas sp.]